VSFFKGSAKSTWLVAKSTWAQTFSKYTYQSPPAIVISMSAWGASVPPCKCQSSENEAIPTHLHHLLAHSTTYPPTQWTSSPFRHMDLPLRQPFILIFLLRLLLFRHMQRPMDSFIFWTLTFTGWHWRASGAHTNYYGRGRLIGVLRKCLCSSGFSY
jgi:hypothetical protein